MIKKFFTGIIYLTVALACINGISGYFYIEDEPGEYQKTINMLEYQLGYDSVYITHPQNEPSVEISADVTDTEKVVYLTFDDGPSQRTTEILDILEKYDIKVSDIFASDGFVRGHSFRGYLVKSFSEIKATYSDFVILLSFASNRSEVIDMLAEIKYLTYFFPL